MKNLFLLFIAFLTCSCGGIKIAAERNSNNVKEIGVSCYYNKEEVSKADSAYINGVVNNFITGFNAGKHGFVLHPYTPQDLYVITLRFQKVHFSSNTEVAFGYVVSAIGLILTPITVLNISDQQLFFVFWFFPRSKINFEMSYSQNLCATGKRSLHLRAKSNSMIRVSSKRYEVTSRRMLKKLNRYLLDTEAQLKEHSRGQKEEPTSE